MLPPSGPLLIHVLCAWATPVPNRKRKADSETTRAGYGIGPPELIRILHQVREPFNVNLLAQVAAQASLRDPRTGRNGR